MLIDNLLLENKVEEAQNLAQEKIKTIRQKWQEEGITNPANTFISIYYWCKDVSLSLLSLMFFYHYKDLLVINFGYTLSVLFSGIIQGTIWTGLWVLAHECGHGAFSKYKIINDIFGYITHSSLLVPYFSWQFSH
jgi:fatty acid desaturase